MNAPDSLNRLNLYHIVHRQQQHNISKFSCKVTVTFVIKTNDDNKMEGTLRKQLDGKRFHLSPTLCLEIKERYLWPNLCTAYVHRTLDVVGVLLLQNTG